MADQKVDTAAALETAQKQLEAAQAADDAAKAAAAGPRAPSAIVTDLLTRIVDRLGNRPELAALIKELVAVNEPPQPEEKPAA
jgi:hypothetical protein